MAKDFAIRKISPAITVLGQFKLVKKSKSSNIAKNFKNCQTLQNNYFLKMRVDHADSLGKAETVSISRKNSSTPVDFTIRRLQTIVSQLDSKFHDNSANSDDSLESLSPDDKLKATDGVGIVNLDQAAQNYRDFTDSLLDFNENITIKTAFSIRSGTNSEIPEFLSKIGVDYFNCVSKSEIKTLKRLLKSEMRERVCFSSCVKPRPVLQLVGKSGVRQVTVRSVEDVVRVGKTIKDAQLIFDLTNAESDREQFSKVLTKIAESGLILKGFFLDGDCVEDLITFLFRLGRDKNILADVLKLTFFGIGQKNRIDFKTVSGIHKSEFIFDVTEQIFKQSFMAAHRISAVHYFENDQVKYVLNSFIAKVKTENIVQIVNTENDYINCEIFNEDDVNLASIKRFSRMDVGDWIYFDKINLVFENYTKIENLIFTASK